MVIYESEEHRLGNYVFSALACVCVCVCTQYKQKCSFSGKMRKTLPGSGNRYHCVFCFSLHTRKNLKKSEDCAGFKTLEFQFGFWSEDRKVSVNRNIIVHPVGVCVCKHAACKKQPCVLRAVEQPAGSALLCVEIAVLTLPTEPFHSSTPGYSCRR